MSATLKVELLQFTPRGTGELLDAGRLCVRHPIGHDIFVGRSFHHVQNAIAANNCLLLHFTKTFSLKSIYHLKVFKVILVAPYHFGFKLKIE